MFLNQSCNLFGSVDYLSSTTICDGEVQVETIIVLRRFLYFLDELLNSIGKKVYSADSLDTHIILMDDLGPQDLFQDRRRDRHRG